MINKLDGYVNGKIARMQPDVYPTQMLKVTKALRKKVNKMLSDFLDSDEPRMEINFNNSVVPHTVVKAYVNFKTCSNCWDQYVIAVFWQWPDVIGKFVASASTHRPEDVVMLNEVRSDNYGHDVYVPKGFTVVSEEEYAKLKANFEVADSKRKEKERRWEIRYDKANKKVKDQMKKRLPKM
jgi:hypothetical protein